MKLKQTIIVGFMALVLGVGILIPAQTALAVDSNGTATTTAGKCGDIDTAIITCDANNDGGIKENAIWKVLVLILNIMMAGVGILAVAGIVYGSVLYASAGDNAGQVTKAKDIIVNVVIGLVAFGLMYTLLNFLIPGGVFG